MDAEARKMLNDLGTGRRDAVSAPEDESKGRAFHQDPRGQAAVSADFDDYGARRQRHEQNDSEEQKAKVKAWNTQTNFEADEAISQLENRFSGQGHRAALNGKNFSHDDDNDDNDWNSLEKRVGPERVHYLKERAANHHNKNNNGHGSPKAMAGNQDEFLKRLTQSNSSPFHTHAPGRLSNGRRVAPPPRVAQHERASDPRSFGTVRFGPGSHRAQENTTGAAPVMKPGNQAVPTVRTSVINGSPVQTSQRAPNTTHQTKVSNGPAAESLRSLSAATPPVLRRPGLQAGAPPTTYAVASHSDTSPPDTASPVVCYYQALGFAADPGEKCDTHYKRYPHRLKYLTDARKQLIKETIDLAKVGNEKAIREYLETHKDRKWMFDAAKEAKRQVEQDTDEQIREYCATNTNQKPFVDAAIAVFAPDRHDVFAQPKSTTEKPIQPIPLSPVDSALAEPPVLSSDASTVTSEAGSSDTYECIDSIAPSTPHSSTGGMLSVTFWDVAESFLGVHQLRLKAPVRATMTVSSLSKDYNPRDMITDLEAMAQKMQRTSTGLEGVTLTDDGLWVDDEEL